LFSVKREQLAGMNQHYKKYSLDYFLDAQENIGFQNIEFWLGVPHFWLDSMSYSDCKDIKKKFSKRGLKIVSTTSPSIDYQYQYAALEKWYFEKSFKYFSNGIKATSEFGAGIMTVNSGWGYLNEDFETSFKRSKEMISKLCDVAKAEGIILALESLTSIETNIVNNIATTKRMFDEINHPSLKIMVDTVATSFAGEKITDWFKEFDNDLVHMHFIDGNYLSYSHLVWGDGEYSLEKQIQYLNENKYEGYLVQEIDDEIYLEDPVSADKKNMKKLLEFVKN
jgi:protein FrlC